MHSSIFDSSGMNCSLGVERGLRAGARLVAKAFPPNSYLSTLSVGELSFFWMRSCSAK